MTNSIYSLTDLITFGAVETLDDAVALADDYGWAVVDETGAAMSEDEADAAPGKVRLQVEGKIVLAGESCGWAICVVPMSYDAAAITAEDIEHDGQIYVIGHE